MKDAIKYFHLGHVSLTAIVILALEQQVIGYGLVVIGLVTLLPAPSLFRRHMALIHVALAVLGSVEIGTTTKFPLGPIMGIALLLSVAGPYLYLRVRHNDHTIKFPFRSGTPWTRRDITYIFVIIFAAYLILPPMLRSADSYLNWVIDPGLWGWLESYIGLNMVGFWDELFFVSTVFALLKRHFPLWAANLGQATLFTSFLYVLGFQGWAPLVIFPFALSQGYMFNKTHSLTYVLAIHLTIDLILHLTLIELNHPEWINFIIT